ncbi:hypothetical protein [Burkholderia glumae]|nr:hypothetical protein [Burkholderia glumae]
MSIGAGAAAHALMRRVPAGFGAVLDIATIGFNNYSENLKFKNPYIKKFE